MNQGVWLPSGDDSREEGRERRGHRTSTAQLLLSGDSREAWHVQGQERAGGKATRSK